MTTSPDQWAYGDFAPDPHRRDLVGLKARWILDQLPAKEAPCVLDYGTGEGKHLHLIRKVRPLARLVGVDIRKPHSSADFEFHQVMMNALLPFADGTFDYVISCDVLEHVENIEHSLDEIHRVLRRGGTFAGFVPAEGGFGPYGFFRALDPHIFKDTKDHQHAYTIGELSERLSSRFEILKLSYSYHLIGSALDAAFFASFKIPRLGAKLESFWRGQENEFYRAGTAGASSSLIGRLTQLANRIAYYESRLFKNLPLGAKGLHFYLVKR